MGHALQPREQEAYWHLWAVIGHGMGVSDEVLPKDLREAFWLEKAIARRQFAPSDEGRALAQSLLDAFEQAEPAPLPKGVAANFMRQLLGPELADLLGLPPSQRPLDLLLALQRFRNAAAGLLRPSGTFDAAAALAEARSLSIPQAFAHQGFPFALQLGNAPPT
jgi:hypothetical protein